MRERSVPQTGAALQRRLSGAGIAGLHEPRPLAVPAARQGAQPLPFRTESRRSRCSSGRRGVETLRTGSQGAYSPGRGVFPDQAKRDPHDRDRSAGIPAGARIRSAQGMCKGGCYPSGFCPKIEPAAENSRHEILRSGQDRSRAGRGYAPNRRRCRRVQAGRETCGNRSRRFEWRAGRR